MATAFANLECGVCTYYYDSNEHKPKTLPNCGHVFCQKCLIHLNENKDSEEVRCPTCDATQNMTPYPNGVVDFPTERFRLEVLDDFLCTECGELSPKVTKKCGQCPLKSCKTCRRRHQSAEHCELLHELHDIKRHARDDVINRCLDQMTKHKKIDIAALQREIREKWQNLRAELDACFTAILNHVDTIVANQETLNNAIACRDFVQEAKASMDRGVDLTALKSEIKRMKALITGLSDADDFDLGPANINLDTTSISASIKQFVDTAIAKTVVTPTVKTPTLECHDYQKKGQLMKRLNGTESGAKFAEVFDVAICPVTGNIHVTEPSYVRVYSDTWQLIRRFKTETGNGCCYIVVNSRGQLIVSEFWGHRIHIYSASGELVSRIGARGSDEGQFQLPCHVTCDSDDQIYVADSGNHRISVHDHEGKFIKTIGSDVLTSPYDLVVNDRKQIITTDRNRHQISVLDEHGTLLVSISSAGDKDLIDPSVLCIDSAGRILVVDGGNSNTPPCIVVFAADMSYQYRVPIQDLDSKSTCIIGVAATVNGDIIMSNKSSGEILVI